MKNTYDFLGDNSSLYIWLGADQNNHYQPLGEFMVMMKDSGFESEFLDYSILAWIWLLGRRLASERAARARNGSRTLERPSFNTGLAGVCSGGAGGAAALLRPYDPRQP